MRGVKRRAGGALLAAAPLALSLTLAVACAGGLATPLAARAEAAPADPIDTAMQNCLARADRSTPAGQVQCIDAARDAWRGAIDAAERSIAANAPDKPRHAWEESQRRWLAWRKDEMALVRAVFETTRGTVYVMTEANVALQPVRDRAIAMRHAAAQFADDAPAPPAGPPDAADKRAPRLRACSLDAECEHARFDLSRYYRKLREKLPARSRLALAHAERAWHAYFDATAPLGSEAERVDLIGARVATLKRLSETVGND